jgi:carbonic anhydrase
MLQQYSYKAPKELLESHECEALVITCMDFRFHETTSKFIREGLKISTFDLATSPGACKKLNPDIISLSKKLHNIKQVIIVNHATCGAYAIKHPDAELEAQSQDLKKADAILGDLFPDLSIRLFFAKRDVDKVTYQEIK